MVKMVKIVNIYIEHYLVAWKSPFYFSPQKSV